MYTPVIHGVAASVPTSATPSATTAVSSRYAVIAAPRVRYHSVGSAGCMRILLQIGCRLDAPIGVYADSRRLRAACQQAHPLLVPTDERDLRQRVGLGG